MVKWAMAHEISGSWPWSTSSVRIDKRLATQQLARLRGQASGPGVRPVGEASWVRLLDRYEAVAAVA